MWKMEKTYSKAVYKNVEIVIFSYNYFLQKIYAFVDICKNLTFMSFKIGNPWFNFRAFVYKIKIKVFSKI